MPIAPIGIFFVSGIDSFSNFYYNTPHKAIDDKTKLTLPRVSASCVELVRFKTQEIQNVQINCSLQNLRPFQ